VLSLAKQIDGKLDRALDSLVQVDLRQELLERIADRPDEWFASIQGGPLRRGILNGMADVTQILAAIEQGDPHAPEQLLPLVYDELRRLAAEKLAHEQPGQTLQATALVHEAYLRLLGGKQTQDWDGRRHFFFAAAEAMRRILIDRARHKQTRKAGGGRRRLHQASTHAE